MRGLSWLCTRLLFINLLSASLGCAAENIFDDEGAGATTGGSTTGAAGTRAATGDGGRSTAGGGGSSSGGIGGRGDEAATGETGIFVGVTAAHNAARSALDVALPPLTWSNDLAEFAQQWSDDLAGRCGTIEHRDQRRYGENIALRGSSRLSTPFSSEAAVAGWVAEVACWDFGTISGTERCDATCVQGLSSNGCGHYTQVVWRNTQRVGCGYSTCESQGFTFEVWVCNYDPPGNFIGQTPY